MTTTEILNEIITTFTELTAKHNSKVTKKSRKEARSLANNLKKLCASYKTQSSLESKQ